MTENAFSNASSDFSIGVVIGNKWKAWRLVPGWKAADGRDIGWAGAVGLELLARTHCTESESGQHFRVFGDNKESSKDGRKEGAEFGRLTKSSDASTTSQILTNAFLSCATLPANKTQQRRPQEDSTLQLLISSQQSAYQLLSGNISSSRFPPPPPHSAPLLGQRPA